jgi:hypothetical protein
MLLIDSPEIESRYVLVRTFEWRGLLLLLCRVYLCANIINPAFFTEDSWHFRHVTVALLQIINWCGSLRQSFGLAVVLIVLIAWDFIIAPAVLAPLSESRASFLLRFHRTRLLSFVRAFNAQNFAQLLLVFGLSQKFVEVITECIYIEKLRIAHPRRVDGRTVLQIVVPPVLLKAVLLRRTHHLLPACSCPKPLETCTFILQLDGLISAVIVNLGLALLLL